MKRKAVFITIVLKRLNNVEIKKFICYYKIKYTEWRKL